MIQRRRVRLRRRAAGTGPRGSPAGHTAAAGAARLDWLPGLRRQLPDHRRLRGSCAPPCPAARPGRPAVPAAQPAPPARGGLPPAVPARLAREALYNSGGERVYVTKHGLTLLAIRLLDRCPRGLVGRRPGADRVLMWRASMADPLDGAAGQPGPAGPDPGPPQDRRAGSRAGGSGVLHPGAR